jgi:hypothetical protein
MGMNLNPTYPREFIFLRKLKNKSPVESLLIRSNFPEGYNTTEKIKKHSKTAKGIVTPDLQIELYLENIIFETTKKHGKITPEKAYTYFLTYHMEAHTHEILHVLIKKYHEKPQNEKKEEETVRRISRHITEYLKDWKFNYEKN